MEQTRVLVVLGKLNRGGAETMVMNLYRQIDRTRIQFDFMIHTEEQCDYDDEIRSLGGRIYHMPNYRVVNHFAYKRSWIAFFQAHKEYSVIHGHMSSTASIYLKIAKSFGFKTIVHSHSTSVEKGLKGLIKRVLQHSLKNGTYIDKRFACGNLAGKWLFGNHDFQIINNAIYIKNFLFSEDVRKKTRCEHQLENSFVVGNVSRFHEQKNHLFLLDIFNGIYKRNTNAVLLLVGDGELRSDIEEKINRLGLQKSVILTGIKPNVNELMMAMDVFLFPSLWEGLPVTMIEAQASGIHSVISNTVSQEVQMTELVEFLSLEDSADLWAEKVLAHDDGYVRRNTNQEIIAAGYDISHTASWLQDFYLNCAK